MRGTLFKAHVLWIVIIVLLAGCSPLSRKMMTRTLRAEEQKLKNHIGFVAFDIEKNRLVYAYQADRYFTPASNTKVLTLYTGLRLLTDSIPAIKYIERNDSLIFWGLGDNSFLNIECYNNFKLYNFLKNSRGTLYFSPSNFQTTHFGRGWAWDDFNDDYSAERSPLPIYGNSFSLFPLPDQLLIVPSYFRKFYTKGVSLPKAAVKRDISSNRFTYHPALDKKYKDFSVPFHVDVKLIADLLQDTLRRKVVLVEKRPDPSARILYSTPVDSLYTVMMKQSDNDIAEQLLLNCSSVLSDSLSPEIPIRYIQQNYFSKFSDKPVWVDGSGLSRYNLVTPRFMVDVWKEIYQIVPRERLFQLLATGGEEGTLKRYFVSEKPYVFGKTGTLSNNHSLSGFLITKKERILVFSFMNANYVAKTEEVRRDMERILKLYYEHY